MSRTFPLKVNSITENVVLFNIPRLRLKERKKSSQITEPVNRLTWFERWTDFILTESWRLLDSFIILTPGKHLQSQHKWPGWGRGALGQNDVVVKGEREKEEDS